ncbi:hypothetical protein Sjap_004623 [Stephania japonica]|uniref:PGG domain-containing protein n=1 Tax=Stephania japonica TaxID=461633 RepID=A0AAP0K4W2_9MAGN
MNGRLLEAAQTGNVGILFELLKAHPLALHAIPLTSNETPLHVASMVGQLNFVKEMIGLKPEFTGKLNQDGFSPMHLASANGYLEIVRELMKVDSSHSRLSSGDGRTPLHLAVLNGRIDVIHELLSSCPESVEDVTFNGNTTLHLAVLNNQFEALKVIVEWLKQHDKEALLNWTDKQGNAVLHIATFTKRREVIELLLGKDTVISAGAVEINALNECSLTALDIVQGFPIEGANYWQIEKILLAAGAKRAHDILHLVSAAPNASGEDHIDESTAPSSSSGTLFDGIASTFRFQKGRDSPSEVRSDLLVVAALIAMATYQAGLSPPGGYWQDDNLPINANSTNTDQPHHAGKSILGTKSTFSYGLFLFSNSAGFYMSIYLTHVLTWRFPLWLELQMCLFGMAITYFNAMVQQSPGVFLVTFDIYAGVVQLSLPLVFLGARVLYEKWRRTHPSPSNYSLLKLVASGVRLLYVKWRCRHRSFNCGQ